MWTIENRDGAIEFIRNHIDAMEEGRYAWLYSLIEPSYFGIPIFTQVLWSCDIHPELEGLTRIPNYFARGLEVESVHLAEGVKYIGYKAFQSCSQLKSVYFPRSLKEIDSFAFHRIEIDQLDIYYAGTVEEWRQIRKLESWMDDRVLVEVHCVDGSLQYGDW